MVRMPIRVCVVDLYSPAKHPAPMQTAAASQHNACTCLDTNTDSINRANAKVIDPECHVNCPLTANSQKIPTNAICTMPTNTNCGILLKLGCIGISAASKTTGWLALTDLCTDGRETESAVGRMMGGDGWLVVGWLTNWSIIECLWSRIWSAILDSCCERGDEYPL